MSDLISRQAAIDAVRSYYDEQYALCDSIEELIEKLPSAEPERKKGNEKCSNKLPCGWCSLFDSPCLVEGGEKNE